MKDHLTARSGFLLHLISAVVLMAGSLFGSTPILGTSYSVVNATTKANLTDQTSKVEEELWCRRIIMGADYQYQDNPLVDEFSGGPDSGKAIIRIVDTEKVHGSTVNIPTVAGFGGPGVAGSGDRIGNEQKIQVGNFQIVIGRFWFGVGFNSVARDETVIGGRLDRIITDGLRTLHAKKRNDDILMKILQLRNATTWPTGYRNIIRPDGVLTRAALVSANTIDTPVITLTRNTLSGLGAMPMSIGSKDSGGSYSENFMFFSTQIGLGPLGSDTAYLDAQTNAGVRGDANRLFKGGYSEWDDVGIYRWYMRDHGNWGPVGSPLCPRLFLGAALTGANTGSFVVGGGSVAAAATLPAPKYTEFFESAPYTFHDGSTIAAVTSVTNYLMIINSDGTGWNVYSYKVNDGNKITIFARVTLSLTGEGSSHDHPLGSLVVPCSANGNCFNYALGFGREMILTGMGTINGSTQSPQMGKRTEEHRNHDMDHGIGAEAVWGSGVIKRADGVAPNVVVVEHSIKPLGAPTIT